MREIDEYKYQKHTGYFVILERAVDTDSIRVTTMRKTMESNNV